MLILKKRLPFSNSVRFISRPIWLFLYTAQDIFDTFTVEVCNVDMTEQNCKLGHQKALKD